MQVPRLTLATLLILCGTLLAQTNPIPFVNQPLVPESAAPGGTGFTLTVNGTGFVSGAVVNWNGSARSTTFISSSELHATIPAADIASPISAAVTVSNPSPGVGASNAAYFNVTLPAPAVRMLTHSHGVLSEFTSMDPVSADFNNDGNLDLAITAQSFGSRPSRDVIFLGDGFGGFTKARSVVFGGRAGLQIAGDFNGDGNADLALLTAPNQVSVLLGNGDGTFQPQVDTLIAVDPADLVTGDFNQDGKLDLAIACTRDDIVSVLLGRGDGSFSRMDVPTGGVGPSSLATGDFDRDGKLDLAIVEGGSSQITIMLGSGDGNFTFARDIFVMGFPATIAAADLNGDGNLDLIVATQGQPKSWLNLYLGNGDSTFQDPQKVVLGRTGGGSVRVADMNGDNKPDFMVFAGSFNGATFMSVWLADDSGGYVRSFKGAAGSNFNFLQTPVLADFNSDGKLDLVAANGTKMAVLLQNPISLSPTSLSFGTHQIGDKTKPKPSILNNSGSSALAISGFAFEGQSAKDFSQTNDCPASLPAGASCTIQVRFKPTRRGKRASHLRISDDGPKGHETLQVEGHGS